MGRHDALHPPVIGVRHDTASLLRDVEGLDPFTCRLCRGEKGFSGFVRQPSTTPVNHITAPFGFGSAGGEIHCRGFLVQDSLLCADVGESKMKSEPLSLSWGRRQRTVRNTSTREASVSRTHLDSLFIAVRNPLLYSLILITLTQPYRTSGHFGIRDPFLIRLMNIQGADPSQVSGKNASFCWDLGTVHRVILGYLA